MISAFNKQMATRT